MTHQEKVNLLTRSGFPNAEAIVTAEEEPNRPTLARCLALLEKESGGRNIFGADPGGSALPRAWFDTPVTRAKYTIYKIRRNLGMTPNGVGPCQLTSVGLQKEAERRGGCWKPLHNCEVGFAFFHNLVQANGGNVWEAAYHYNGSGPAAEAYATDFVNKAKVWENRGV